MQDRTTVTGLALHRNLRTPRQLEEESAFTRAYWYTLRHRPERDPDMAACIVVLSKRRLLIDVDRLAEVLDRRRVKAGPREVQD